MYVSGDVGHDFYMSSSAQLQDTKIPATFKTLQKTVQTAEHKHQRTAYVVPSNFTKYMTIILQKLDNSNQSKVRLLHKLSGLSSTSHNNIKIQNTIQTIPETVNGTDFQNIN